MSGESTARESTARQSAELDASSAAVLEARSADELLPLLYRELRRLAGARLAGERPGQTLQPTALVHEAWLRLVGDGDPGWSGKGHFFAAAAQAMRRILVERARQKGRLRHGGGRRRLALEDLEQTAGGAVPARDELILAVDGLVERLARSEPRKARLVELRFFAGLTMPECAATLGVSLGTVERDWRFLRAWMRRQLEPGAPERGEPEER